MHGNRTHRAHLPVNPTGFEVQASHQARFTSAQPRLYQRFTCMMISARGLRRIEHLAPAEIQGKNLAPVGSAAPAKITPFFGFVRAAVRGR